MQLLRLPRLHGIGHRWHTTHYRVCSSLHMTSSEPLTLTTIHLHCPSLLLVMQVRHTRAPRGRWPDGSLHTWEPERLRDAVLVPLPSGAYPEADEALRTHSPSPPPRALCIMITSGVLAIGNVPPVLAEGLIQRMLERWLRPLCTPTRLILTAHMSTATLAPLVHATFGHAW